MSHEKPKPPEQSDSNPFAPMTAFREGGFGGWMKLNAAWLETMGEMGAELAAFVADRIKEDVKTQHRLLNCRDIGEARAIQEEFLRNAVDQYQAETGKLVEIGMSAFSGGDGRSSKSN